MPPADRFRWGVRAPGHVPEATEEAASSPRDPSVRKDRSTRRLFRELRAGIPLLLAALLLAAPAHAATVVWAGSNTTWTTAANWVGGVAPTSTDTVAFKGWVPLATSGWTVTASVTKSGDTTSELNDGRRSTVWSTGNSQSTDDWIHIDLGSSQTFARVDVDVASGTSTEYIRGYNLEVSTDNNSWTSVATGTGTTLLTSISFADQTARYIRITCTSTIANNWTVGELTVWATGSAGTKLPHTGWTATASSSQGGQPASNAVDTDLSSRWGSNGNQSNGLWFKVDLGANHTFTAISVDSYSYTENYPRGLSVQVSTDNSNWSTAATGISPTGEFILISFSAQTARYILLTQTSSYTATPWNIADFNVYGTPANVSLAANTTVAALELHNGVTVTPAATVVLTVTGSFTQSAGTFAAGTGNVLIGDDYTLSGGTFTGSSGALVIADDFTLSSSGTLTAPSGVMQVGGAFNRTGGTFTHNAGRVLLASTGSETFATNDSSFNSLYVNDGLWAYWPFEETATSSTDYSGWGRTATWANSADDNTAHGTTNLPNDRSLGFSSASSSYASFTDSPDVTTAISVSAWVYSISRNSTFPRIIDMPGYELSFANNAQVAPQVNNCIAWTGTLSTGNNGWRTAADTISDGAWYHVVATMTAAGTPTVYINGNLMPLTQPTVPSGTQVTNTGTGIIGNSPAYDRGWNGYIDDMRLYGRVLTQAEVTALYTGGHRTTTTGTQTLSGAVTTVNDVVLAGGTLDVSASACSSASCGVTVGGNWINHGGVFTARTGTVAFNGTGGLNVIRTNRSDFYNLTVSNTGTWTLQDGLNASGLLTMSANGTLAAGAYNIHAASLSKTTGTISGTGVLSLNPTADLALNVNSVAPQLRIEAPRETGLVGYWKLDEGVGTTFADLSGNGNTGTLSNATRWVTSSLAGTSFANRAAVNLGGGSYYGTLGVTNIPSLSAAKSLTCWVNLTSTAGVQHMVSFDDQGGNSIGIGMRGGNLAAWKGGGTVLAQVAAPSTGTWVHVAYTWDGTTHKVYLNGGTPGTGTSSPNSTSVTRGFIGTWDGINELLSGQIDEVRVYNVALTAAQVSNLAAGRYSGVGHTTTLTLGSNSAASGGLEIDNGKFASSSYTMNSSSTTAAVGINSGGTYQVGSATQTMAGGLTVKNGGTLSMPTASGSVAIGADKILTMDGTLAASSATAAIQSASGTYAFRVGSTAGATPTLNITGLQVKNTNSDGMFINYNTGATTTFTRFDNIAFSNGAGTGANNYNLRIYATSLYLTSNGCTFDNGTLASVASNVKLAGDGGGLGSETRAIFGGATCASNQASCEGYDADDDATADGVGDTTGSDGAVVQWVKTAGTDTAGTIEGFPTAAFDWNTFTYYATYVAYHDT
ncbi:MAG TPA: LamG-like jellyroll fold domain-containing protein, partial [Polyangia bacterium]